MGIPDHLLSNSENQTWNNRPGFKLWKKYIKACILPPCLFNLCAEYIMRNAGLEGAQAGIKITGRNINNLSNGNPLQYSCLENPMDGGAWCPWGCKELDTTERLHFFHSVTFIKRFFSSSLLSAIKAVSSAYLRLLIFLPTIDSSLCFIQPSISHDVLCT